MQLQHDMAPIAAWIDEVLSVADDASEVNEIRAEIAELKAFPSSGIRV